MYFLSEPKLARNIRATYPQRMGDPEHPLAAEIRLKMREAFYVQNPEWKQQVWTRGEEIVRNTIHGLTNA